MWHEVPGKPWNYMRCFSQLSLGDVAVTNSPYISVVVNNMCLCAPPFTCDLQVRCHVSALCDFILAAALREALLSRAVVLRAGHCDDARSFVQVWHTSLIVSSDQKADCAYAFPFNSHLCALRHHVLQHILRLLVVPCQAGPIVPLDEWP